MKLSKTRVLLCSHSEAFLAGIKSQLMEAYDVQSASTSDQVQFLVKEWEPSVVVVDDTSQETSNLTGKLRQNHTHRQLGLVAVGNGQSTLSDEERVFRSGADFFLKAPTEFRSLNCRLQALTKRMRSSHSPSTQIQHRTADSVITFAGIKVYPEDFLIKRDGEIISTTPTQFRLLLAFVSHQEQLLSRAWIKEAVWENANISPRSIDAQISKLKKLLPDLDRFLVNIYGKGYILTQPKEEVA